MLKFGIPRSLFLVFGSLTLFGSINIAFGYDFAGDLVKVMLGAFAAYLFFYYVVFKQDFNIHTLFKFYLFGALICAIYGFYQLFQFTVGAVNLAPGGLFGGRVASLFGEPTYYAMFLSGALVVAIHDFFNIQSPYYYNKLTAAAVILGVFTSFSGTLPGSLVIAGILFLIHYRNFKILIFGVPVFLIGFSYLLSSDEELAYRLESTKMLFSEQPEKEGLNIFKYHGSSLILYNNFYVAFQNFKKNPLFGGGVGSHPVAFAEHSLTRDIEIAGINQNAKDASSMLNRLMSETGLFGLLLFFFIIRNNFVRRNTEIDDEKLWLISTAVLTVILINMARQGHYFMNGFPFFVWMYIRAKMEYKKKLEAFNLRMQEAEESPSLPKANIS